MNPGVLLPLGLVLMAWPVAAMVLFNVLSYLADGTAGALMVGFGLLTYFLGFPSMLLGGALVLAAGVTWLVRRLRGTQEAD